LLEDFKDHVSNNWDQSKRAWSDGDWALYVTGFTWHMPYAYDDERRHSENSEAWGGGVGRYVYDSNGNYHGLYAMASISSGVCKRARRNSRGLGGLYAPVSSDRGR
jgi:hypothetical protein